MKCSHTLGIWLLGLALSAMAGTTSASTTLYTDFESPVFTPGAIGGNCCGAGQGGWAGSGTVTTAQAHSGSQSVLTSGNNIVKALDPSQGEYPFAGFFDFPTTSDWWVQAYVYVNSGGGGATMTLYNSLGGCPLIQISGNATPLFHSCLAQDTSQGSLAAGIFDQWVLLRMAHTVSMGQGLDMSIIGPNINLTIDLAPYSGPGSGSPQYVSLAGNAYWDDISAGHGLAPAVVPVPATGWLLGSGCLSLLGWIRRKATA